MIRRNKQAITILYISLIAGSIVPLLFFSTREINYSRIPYILFWLILEIAADSKPFRTIMRENMKITMSFAVQLSLIILLPLAEAVLVVVLAALVVEFIQKRSWYKAFFNAGQYGISIFIACFLFRTLKLSDARPLDIILDMPAVAIAALSYYLLNTLLVSLVVSLTAGYRVRDVFSSEFKVITVHFLSMVPIGIVTSLIYDDRQPYVVLIMIPTLLMVDQSLGWYYSLVHETRETLNVLAGTIDERDSYTFSHSKNVAVLAKKIAMKLGLSLDDVSEIEMAGQVHDLGKIGIRDHILYKKTALEGKELSQIEKHPEIAYRLLKNLNPYKKGAEYVLYHHERYDGKGYPGRATGKEIPLGAKILSVADSYDAMTTDRPYRKALSQAEAVNELKRCSGTQFDPKVVNAFIEILKEEYNYSEEE